MYLLSVARQCSQSLVMSKPGYSALKGICAWVKATVRTGQTLDIRQGDAEANGRISPQGQSGASRNFQVPRAKKARIQITINP
jgi:hypothetical protein